MIKTNIKMRVTPEQSKKVQEICFKNGINYRGNEANKERIEADFLYVKMDILTYGLYEHVFKSAEYQEIDADLFIKTNGNCELTDPVDIFEDICNQINKETYLTKYTSQPKDLESALKKIENLHIALNKKVEKNKNQALEITKLLEQKKLLKKEISYKQNNDNGLRSLLKEAQEALDDLNKTIDLLEDRIKEKDTIISYLESKLK